MNDKGSAAVHAVYALLFISSSVIGIVCILQGISVYRSAAERKLQSKERLNVRLEEILLLMLEDSTPESDSPFDGFLQGGSLGFSIDDVSSAFHPFLIDKTTSEMLESLGAFRQGESAASFLRFRAGNLSTLGAGLSRFFTESARLAYTTDYGYANVFICDTAALCAIFVARTGSQERAGEFLATLETARRTASDNTFLKNILGADFSLLFPLLTDRPAINIHFAHKDVITAILTHPAFDVDNPRDKATLLVSSRERKELSPEDLKQIIRAHDDNPVFHYLGCATWFWRIRITEGNVRLSAIAARIPDSDRKRFAIIEKRYDP